MDTQRQKDKGKKSENPGRRGSQKGRFRRHAMGTRQSGEEGGGFERRWAFFQGPYVARVCSCARVNVGGSVPTLDLRMTGVIWQAEQPENTWVFCLLPVYVSI